MIGVVAQVVNLGIAAGAAAPGNDPVQLLCTWTGGQGGQGGQTGCWVRGARACASTGNQTPIDPLPQYENVSCGVTYFLTDRHALSL